MKKVSFMSITLAVLAIVLSIAAMIIMDNTIMSIFVILANCCFIVMCFVDKYEDETLIYKYDNMKSVEENEEDNLINRDPNCFPIKVWQFVNRFVPHNYTVNLYTTSRGVLEDDPQVPCTNWTLKWRGMDWQITMANEEWNEYHKVHHDVQRCPFRNWWVVGISGIRKPEEHGRVDVVSIVMEKTR